MTRKEATIERVRVAFGLLLDIEESRIEGTDFTFHEVQFYKLVTHNLASWLETVCSDPSGDETNAN